MTKEVPAMLETMILYGLENPEKMYARYRIASQKCILIFYSPPPDDFNDDNLEQGLITYYAAQESFFLRLDLGSIREMNKLDQPNPIDKIMTDNFLTVVETDGLKHFLCFTSSTVRDEWYSHIQPNIGKRKSTVYQPLPITGVSPHQPLVIGNADNLDSSSDSDSDDKTNGKKEKPAKKAIVLKGNPQDYPALANWSTSLIRYGYGSKKGAKRKNWKYRFFVLTQHSFAYFESEKKKNPICSIPISNVRAIYQRKDLQGHEFVMAIDTEDRMHLWEFDTEEELRGWLEDFADHVTIKLQPKTKSSSQKVTTQTLSSLTQSASPSSASMSASLPTNPHAVETKIFDGAVVRKKVVGKSGNRAQDSDSDDSAEDDTCNGEVSKFSKSLLGIDSSSLVKYGFCMKEGGVVHNWKKRFFVLTRGTLSYFKSPNDAQALKVIKVNTITSVIESPQYQGRNFVISVLTHSRNFFMQCESQTLATEWTRELTKCKEYQDRFKPASSTCPHELDELFSPEPDTKGFDTLDTIAPNN